MTKKMLLPALIASLFAASAANAATTLIAIGSLSGNAFDLSSETHGLLENGVAGNLLGGVGSGFAWAGGSTFIALPDRGPNALAYNPLVADTTSYIDRFHTINFSLTQNSGPGLAYNLTPTLTKTTLLSSASPLNYGTGALGTDSTYTLGSGVPALNATNNTNYFTGRSDGFNSALPSSNANNARLDPEGIRVSNDGKSVFVSDEYGPYVRQFDRASGQLIKSFALPGNLAVAVQGPTTASELAPNNTTGRVANKGMEGLAITPDGKTLVGVMQAPLLQDGSKQLRIVTIDIATGATKEFGYRLTTGSGVSEIVAINDHEFLLDERDGKGLGDGTAAVVKQLFKVDITGATDISGVANMTSSTPAVSKTLFLDVVAELNAKGIASTAIPSKLEGFAFGEDLADGRHTLWMANDNDFDTATSGDNKFYVFAIDANTLSTFQAQNITPSAVPVPAAAWLFGSGLLGLAGFARRRYPS
ncbi:hypothetical protein SCD_n02833 [Sulfuricella denitrificans skB26]|uniref:Phytase-like domain-containing protein n=1 Tax=Sulfuricella denitrificans (strain DSM 22764 / NBRC 105220 / skB26) TaxID=1163617 RepID=S6B8B4_SULDS|nr:esterase-like activity of phytase family protein [Sulfuricella denitrificans]BAN36632.1 hypothetical protein SCD_n02833 [Sulfuricella denitrificans skB26]